MKRFFSLLVLAATMSYGPLGQAESVAVRTGFQQVYGQSQDLLDQTALTLQVEYTPQVFANFKTWLIEKNLGFLQNWNFVTEFGYTRYSGSKLSRKTEYVSPSLQLRSESDFGADHRLNYQFGFGAGAIFVERQGEKSTEATSNVLASVAYQNLKTLPELSVGFESGIIFDNDYPINYNGLYVRYLKNF